MKPLGIIRDNPGNPWLKTAHENQTRDRLWRDFKAKNNRKLGAWYKKHLGLDIGEEWTGCTFPWPDARKPKQKGCIVWSIFDGPSDYFGSKQQTLMV